MFVDDLGHITVTTKGSSEPTVLTGLGHTAAAKQLTAGLIARLHINGGTWTSVTTLRKVTDASRSALRWLEDAHGITDLADDRFSPTVAWELVSATGGNGGHQRNLRTFLADAMPAIRSEDGTTHQNLLFGRALPVDEHHLEGYAPEVGDLIEEVARQRVGEWFVRHQTAVKTALGGHLPKDWLNLPAERLLATESSNMLPVEFMVSSRDLAAAAVLLALVDNKGPNLSVIQSYTCDSVERSGDDGAFVTGVKARNREVLRTPAPAGGVFSYAGLLEFLTAATVVDRHFRRGDSDFRRLLFVATGSTGVLTGPEVNRWWWKTWGAWPDRSVTRPEDLSFPRLRKTAVLRGKHKGNGVIGHKKRTARLYLADALPDVILVPGLLDTQNGVTAHWREWMQDFDDFQVEAIERLTAAEQVMDVGVAVCGSGGQSPTDETKPCGLGPVACFVCPNGFRTPEIIPGLLAAVDFTDNIRKYEPTEWLTGEAPILNRLARKALDQFPSPLVDAVTPEEIANQRALVACVYVEGRRVA